MENGKTKRRTSERNHPYVSFIGMLTDQIFKFFTCTEKIARHVYNSCNSIFTPLNYKDVHSYVTQYLTRCAKDPQSLIEKGKGYGVYHVNFDSKAVQQLMLNFSSSVLENNAR